VRYLNFGAVRWRVSGGELMVPRVYGAVEMKCVYQALFS
jgi:hypothetical protein